MKCAGNHKDMYGEICSSNKCMYWQMTWVNVWIQSVWTPQMRVKKSFKCFILLKSWMKTRAKGMGQNESQLNGMHLIMSHLITSLIRCDNLHCNEMHCDVLWCRFLKPSYSSPDQHRLPTAVSMKAKNQPLNKLNCHFQHSSWQEWASKFCIWNKCVTSMRLPPKLCHMIWI